MENVITAAMAYLGVPYRLGAEGPDLMDCSGLIYRAFMDAGEGRRMSGARLGVRSYVRWFAARGGLVLDEADAVRGDLAIWGAGQHMGIYLGDGRAISAVTSGVKVHAIHAIGLPLTGFLRPNWAGKGEVTPLDPTLLLDQGETPVALIPPSAWAPPLDPAAEGAQPLRAGVERPDMRTATSRTFENADGTFTTELHAQPIYYQEPEATEWLPIDLRFSPVKGKHHQPDAGLVSASPVQVSAFPTDHEQGFLTMAAGEQSLALSRVAADDAPAVAPVIAADGRTLDYPAFYGAGTGLRVLARPDGVRTFVALSSMPDANDFAFHLAADGLLPVAQPDGSVTLTDASGATIARIPRPVFIDSSDIDGSGGGIFAAAGSVSVTPDDSGLLITLHVARRFLEEAVYPAFVDLSVADFPVAAPGADVTFVSSRHPDSVFVADERPEQPWYAEALLGRQPGSHADNTTYLSFDDPRAIIGSGRVAATSLELYPYWGSPAGVRFSISSLGSVEEPATELGSVDLVPGAWSDALLSAMPDGAVAISAAKSGQGSWTRLIARDQSADFAFGPRLVITWSRVVPTPWSVLEPQHGDD